MEHITVIGCGGVGSLLSSHIVYKSINDPFLSRLTLIDPDLLEPINLPYLFIGENGGYDGISRIGHPKVVCLKTQLDRIKPPHLTITIHQSTHKDCMIDIDNMVIDCRDTLDEIDYTKFKLCVDGRYGNVIVNPSSLSRGVPTPTKYLLKKDVFYSNYFCAMVCDKFIFSDIMLLQSKRLEYAVELKGMVLHEHS